MITYITAAVMYTFNNTFFSMSFLFQYRVGLRYIGLSATNTLLIEILLEYHFSWAV